MSTSAASYPQWKAPAEEGRTLVWPHPAQLLDDTRQNHTALAACETPVQNVPLRELRRRQRESREISDDQLLLASGHQTELYHPGVWAKDAMASAAAASIGGRALHVAVDTDQPKRLSLRWAEGSSPISDDANLTTVPWAGLLHGASSRHLQHLRGQLAAANWKHQSLTGEFLGILGEKAVQVLPLSQALMVAMETLDESLGLERASMLLSPLLGEEPYLLLVHHLLARAEEFAAGYNRALADYRRAHRIATPARPMPDLSTSAVQCESPFWLDDAAGTRKRAFVEKIAGHWTLAVEGGDQFAFDPAAEGWDAAGRFKAFLHAHQLRFSPRALTLTLYLRLLLADQFIHGIGGGRYDQVSDAVIAGFFGITPPRFCVTTATLYFPGATDRSRACVPCLAHEGHHLMHQLLGEEKLAMVEQIDDLPRRSNQRQAIFSRMHGRLSAAAVENPAVRDWEIRFAAENEQRRREQFLFDRELFYATQSRERLQALLSRYREQFARVS